jgi:hypothetical protein
MWVRCGRRGGRRGCCRRPRRCAPTWSRRRSASGGARPRPHHPAHVALVDRPDQDGESVSGCQGALRTRLVPRKPPGRRRARAAALAARRAASARGPVLPAPQLAARELRVRHDTRGRAVCGLRGGQGNLSPHAAPLSRQPYECEEHAEGMRHTRRSIVCWTAALHAGAGRRLAVMPARRWR